MCTTAAYTAAQIAWSAADAWALPVSQRGVWPNPSFCCEWEQRAYVPDGQPPSVRPCFPSAAEILRNLGCTELAEKSISDPPRLNSGTNLLAHRVPDETPTYLLNCGCSLLRFLAWMGWHKLIDCNQSSAGVSALLPCCWSVQWIQVKRRTYFDNKMGLFPVKHVAAAIRKF